MHDHDKDRGRPYRAGTHFAGGPRRRHAFTIIEFVGALAMFMVTVALLSAATTTAMTSRTQSNRAISIASDLDRLVDITASLPFSELTANTFTPPSLCDGQDLGRGSQSTSCVKVRNVDQVVTWNVALGPDAAGADGGPSEAADFVTVSGTTKAADGGTLTRTRTVAAPSAGFVATSGLVRVRLIGDWETFTSPILLLNDTAPFDTIIASGRPDDAGVAQLRVPQGSCTSAVPCRIAVGIGTNRAMNATHGLDDAAARGITGVVVAVPGQVSDAVARIYEVGQVDLLVDAQNETSLRRLAGANLPDDTELVAGSVCIWVGFSDGRGDVWVPKCNTSSGGRVIPISSYEPDPVANPGLRLPIPTGTVLQVRADNPESASCPAVAGQRYWDGFVWQNVESVGICSTWTWGQPSSLVVTADPTPLAIATSTNTLTTSFPEASMTIPPSNHGAGLLVFSGPSASPSAGHANEAVFAQPRRVDSDDPIIASLSTSPQVTAPELDNCPDTHCYSSSATPSIPSIKSVTSSPSEPTTTSWPFAVPAVEVGDGFQVTFDDAENESIDVRILNPPTGMELCDAAFSGCVVVTDGYLATPTGMPSGESLYFKYPGGASISSTNTMVLQTRKTLSPAAFRNESVLIVPGSGLGGVVVDAAPVTVAQETQTPAWAWAWALDGSPAVSATLQFSAAPAGASYSAASAATNATGVAYTLIDGGTAPVGSTPALVSLNGLGVTQTVTVTPRPKNLTVTTQDADQGGLANVNVTVLDAAGDELADWAVAVGPRGDDGLTPLRGAKVGVGSCITDVSGSCLLVATFEPRTPAGVFSVVAYAGGLSTPSGTQILNAAAARFAAEPVSVAQGQSAPMTITVYDGAGATLPGVAVNVSGNNRGLTVTPASGVSDGDGKLTVTVNADASAFAANATTPQEIAVSSGNVTGVLYVDVKAVGTSLSVTPPTTLNIYQGNAAAVTFTVRDTNNFPVVGANVVSSATSDPKIAVSSNIVTDATGEAVINITVTDDAAVGTYSTTVTAPGTAGSITLTINVVGA